MAKGNTLRGQTSVDIGGNEHEVLLNMNAFRLMTQDRGIELGDLDDFVSKNPLEFVPTVVFWGIMNAADFAGQDRPEVKYRPRRRGRLCRHGQVQRVVDVHW